MNYYQPQPLGDLSETLLKKAVENITNVPIVAMKSAFPSYEFKIFDRGFSKYDAIKRNSPLDLKTDFLKSKQTLKITIYWLIAFIVLFRISYSFVEMSYKYILIIYCFLVNPLFSQVPVFTPGIYLVQIKNIGNQTINSKLIVQ